MNGNPSLWPGLICTPRGSFRVRSTNYLLNLRDPPPISMKFGTLSDNYLVTGSVALMDFITYLVTKIIFRKSNIGDPTLEI